MGQSRAFKQSTAPIHADHNQKVVIFRRKRAKWKLPAMDRDCLLIKLRALLLNIIGVEIYYIDIDEDLREKKSFDQGDEKVLKESIEAEFNVNLDLSKLEPLTLEKIADYIMQEKSHDLKGGEFTRERKKNQYWKRPYLLVF